MALTEERRRFWQAYVDELLPLMELRDWRVEVRPEPPEEDEAAAHISLTYGRKVARITLNTVHEEYAPEEQRHSIVHELLHCHLEPAAAPIVDGSLAYVMGSGAYHTLVDTFRRQFEYGIDAIAVGWADQLPLPPGDRSMTEEDVEELFDLEPGDVGRSNQAQQDVLRAGAPLGADDQAQLYPCGFCDEVVPLGVAHVKGKDGCTVVHVAGVDPEEARARIRAASDDS